MDFRNAYAQGFARVAACTLPVAAGRPRTQRRARHRAGAGAATTTGVAVALFPELCLSRLRHRRPAPAGRRSSTPSTTPSSRSPRPPPTLLPRRRRGRPAAARQPALQLRRRHPPRRGPRRRAEVLPAQLPRVLREAALRARRRTSASSSRPHWPGADVDGDRSRSAPTCSSSPDDLPGLAVHVEVCEDMWVPVPPSHEAALAGRDGPAQPLRLADHRRPRRGPPPARPLRERALQRRLPLCRRRRGRVARPTCRGTA